jgi:Mg-chelatase subunit ChlD
VDAEAAIRSFDLVFGIDGTGSMYRYLNQVKDRVISIINQIEASEFGPRVSLGIVVYGDHPPQDSMLTKTFPLTGDLDEIKKNVKSLPKCRGGDYAEAVADGLREGVQMNWRETAGKAIILIGDAPPHGYAGKRENRRGIDSFPKGCPCGTDPLAEAADAMKLGITIYAVGVNPELELEKVWKDIARATEGAYMTLDDAGRLQDIILDAIGSEMKKMESDLKVYAAMQAAKTNDAGTIGATLGMSKEEVNKTMVRLGTRKLTVTIAEVGETKPAPAAGGRFCRLCGRQLSEGARFCGFCGSAVPGRVPAEPPGWDRRA